jgi:16S rRNA (cytosine967-C5)-methyltransferase
MPVSPARVAAFEILQRMETTDAYASELLHSSRFAKLSPADHGLLTELVMGVLRWRAVLDNKIAEHYGRPSKDRVHADRMGTFPLLPKVGRSGAPPSREIPALVPTNATRRGRLDRTLAKLDLEVLMALRLGAYQILFLDRVPRHAAVNESVELVKSAHKRSAAGLVNAVLRKIERAPSDLEGSSTDADWLVERWTRIYGSDAALKICEYNQRAPRSAVRLRNPHPSKTAKGGAPASVGVADPTPLPDDLRDEGVQLEPGKLLSTAFTVKSGDITRTKAFRERRLMIQDEASQLVALLVGRGKRTLDCCAAPGGKTRIIAEQNPEAMVLAIDLHPQRAALLRKLVPAKNVHVIAGDVRKMPFRGNFDRILVDAPCSGTGTLARNPEIKWRLRPRDLPRLQEYQREILLAAMKRVARGGRVVYSTCSLEPEENLEVVEQALETDASFRLVDCSDRLQELRASGELVWEEVESLMSGPYLRTIPGVHPCDGFFAAIFEKT